jgi:hypothetical protein
MQLKGLPGYDWYLEVIEGDGTHGVARKARRYWFAKRRCLRQVHGQPLSDFFLNDDIINDYLDLVRQHYPSLPIHIFSSLVFAPKLAGQEVAPKGWSSRWLKSKACKGLDAAKLVFAPLHDEGAQHWRLGIVDIRKTEEQGRAVLCLDPLPVSSLGSSMHPQSQHKAGCCTSMVTIMVMQ